jgi:UDP-4-amino-4,6-dideoxy-N-acetyl-beta-L-altrosamine N-acetyltransferase
LPLIELMGTAMLRDATDADLETIRRWRNHPKVRGSFIWTDHVTPEIHADWWARVQSDPARRVLIFDHRDVPSGVVLVMEHDPVARSAEWGFFLDVDGLTERDELIPAWVALERAAIDYGFDDLHLTSMGGRTLARNAPVLALHRRFGFRVVPERSYRTTIDGQEEDVVWTELRRPDQEPG